jgi:exosortase
VTYWTGLSEAVSRWEKQEEYSHGYLIPMVVFYILWEKKALIGSMIGPPLWSGLFVILIALSVFAIGEISALFILVQYSFVLLLIGISLVSIGRATRYTVIPILILLFAIPLPYFLEVLFVCSTFLYFWRGM